MLLQQLCNLHLWTMLFDVADFICCITLTCQSCKQSQKITCSRQWEQALILNPGKVANQLWIVGQVKEGTDMLQCERSSTFFSIADISDVRLWSRLNYRCNYQIMDQIIQHLLTPLPELTSSQKADLEKVSSAINHLKNNLNACLKNLT